jgi:YHS domain-containing protein
MQTRFNSVARFVGIAAALVIVVACRKDKPAESSADVDAAVIAKLASADALDGETDKVVAKCAACALRMDGSADLALNHAGYAMHFCSDGCKQRFEKDPVDEILAMDVPES